MTGFPWNLWAYSFSWATEILQLLNKIGLFAFNLIIITIFMAPIIFFFNIKKRYKYLYSISLFSVLFAFYIYGNHSINKNKAFLNSYGEKFNIKVISPNFDLEYGLSKAKVENKETVEVWGSGEARRDFLNVNDMASASVHIFMMEKEIYDKNVKPDCSHINIGSGTDISIAEIAFLIKEIVGFKGDLKFDGLLSEQLIILTSNLVI